MALSESCRWEQAWYGQRAERWEDAASVDGRSLPVGLGKEMDFILVVTEDHWRIINWGMILML